MDYWKIVDKAHVNNTVLENNDLYGLHKHLKCCVDLGAIAVCL